MKCPKCNGKGRVVAGGHDGDRIDPISWIPCSKCVKGWLPYWTEAERAGIKALGKTFKDSECLSVRLAIAIQAYVKSARNVKERA
ncbi:MAG: hypothetical protein PHC68_02590 [Syntrophorhabdaceae bacterium]|nr:hypothetical protein [Syntrophorhabdaceae bacterium]